MPRRSHGAPRGAHGSTDYMLVLWFYEESVNPPDQQIACWFLDHLLGVPWPEKLTLHVFYKLFFKTGALYFQKPLVFIRKYKENRNLSDVRTGRALLGGEHETHVTSFVRALHR